ncbi:hypothetical protein K8I28_03150 [bacterium]|nr:hypothetical protein [bacterium]
MFTRIVLFFLVITGVMFFDAHSQQQTEENQLKHKQRIHLINGNVVDCTILKQDNNFISAQTAFGTLEIPTSEVVKIEFLNLDSQSDTTAKTTPQQIESGQALNNLASNFSTSFLYNSRRKSIATGVGLQAFGAGLLYSEKYTSGALMMLLENALILYPVFDKEMSSDSRTGLLAAGIVLKSLNTFLTIKSINDYNNKLAIEMGLMDQPLVSKNHTRPRILSIGGSAGVKYIANPQYYGEETALPFTFEIRSHYKIGRFSCIPLVLGYQSAIEYTNNGGFASVSPPKVEEERLYLI